MLQTCIFEAGLYDICTHRILDLERSNNLNQIISAHRVYSIREAGVRQGSGLKVSKA